MNTYKQNDQAAHLNSFFRPKSILVMHNAKPYQKMIVKFSFKHYKTDFAIIPRGLTPLLQPVDVQWNKIFKAEMRCLWSNCLGNGEQ